MLAMQNMDAFGIDANLLPVLAALLRERSVSRAAERLGRTQPAISHALARLRDQLGDPLLVRAGPRMTLTPRAEALRDPLQRVLAELSALVRPAAAFDPATTTRRFTLVSTDYIAALVLPRVLPGLRQAAPGLDLLLRAASRGFFAELADGGADLGFVVKVEPAAGIHVRKLYTDRFVCLVRDGHPALRRGLDLAAFLKFPHGLVAPLGASGSFVDDALREQGLGPRRVAVVVPHFSLAPALVADTDLLLTLPERIAGQLAAGGGLRVVPLPLRLAAFTVGVAWHDRVHHDPAVAWLRAQIVAAMRTG